MRWIERINLALIALFYRNCMSEIVISRESAGSTRVGWVDTAKGICIIMVVMLHSTLGVEIEAGAEGWMGYVVSFARPFRMPDFFLISGLFLGLVIDRPWLRYIDRKVVHFAYFYVLWLTIQFAFKAPGMAMEQGALHPLQAYLTAFIQPFGTLWFIYLLPVFFIVTRLVKRVPVWLVLAVSAALEILSVDTGWVIVDEFAGRFVWFYIGYAFARNIFDIAAWGGRNPGKVVALIALWALAQAWLVFTPAPATLAPWLQPDLGTTGARGGIAELPFVSFVLALAGITVVIWIAALLTGRKGFGWLTWLGEHSIVVYLAFFLPMAVMRTLLLKTGIVPDIGTMSVLVTAAGVIGPVVLYAIVKWSGYGLFLFERPRWAWIDKPAPRGKDRLAAAE